MALTPGTRLGPYEVLSALGAGGMGEVYKARDTELERDVAIKNLPEAFATDPERVARFQREAKTLASLNHPNIAQIYGLEDVGGVRALVMELVAGEDLSHRIARGPIPVDEALLIARQLASALEAAHEQDIVHRDLKPANIKVRPDGTVKVLDFGLAKAMEPAGHASDVSRSLTITSPAMTAAGVILGTAAYMSPEQAKGRPADKRADIWAFGCVLFEMLAGVRPFAGGTMSETLAAVMKDEPAWNALPAATPPAIVRLLRRCLAKDASERLRDIGDARIELNELLRGGGVSESGVAPRPAAMRRARWTRAAAGGALLVAGLAAGIGVRLARTDPAPVVMRLNVTPSPQAAVALSGNFRDVAISPDGKRIAYVGANGATLFVRDLDRMEPVRIDGAGMPSQLFFSSDGTWLGFTDGINALRRVPSAGGAVEYICRITQPGVVATAGRDGTIVFAQYGSLWRVRAVGGEPERLTSPDRQAGEADYRSPEFLPTYRALLFSSAETILSDGATSVIDLERGTKKVVLRNGVGARYVSSGHLVYRVGRTLRAVAFDLDRLEVVGAPFPVPEPILITPFGNVANFDVALDGTLLYAAADAPVAARRLVWVDRDGREEAVALPMRAYTYAVVAPGGTQAALDIRDQENDIWVWDFRRSTLRRLTFGAGFNQSALWTPDARQILFVEARRFWAQRVDGLGAPEELAAPANLALLNSISPDGARVVFREDFPATGHDLMMLTMKDRKVQPLLQTPANELNAEISPNGRWLAYESDESGTFEIFVRPFPDVGSGRWQVSNGGGRKPLWGRNNRELFFVSADGVMMAVAIESSAGFSAGVPARLFEANYYLGGASSIGRTYDISADGKRFLMIKPDAARPTSLVVVLNWTEELKRLTPPS